MSRIGDDDWYPTTTAEMLRNEAFWANAERALAGKRGTKFLHELEAALLALQAKRLISGAFARGEEVCALGAVCRARGIDPLEIGEETPQNEILSYARVALGICEPLAAAVMEENDIGTLASETPEARYDRMRRWVRGELARRALGELEVKP